MINEFKALKLNSLEDKNLGKHKADEHPFHVGLYRMAQVCIGDEK